MQRVAFLFSVSLLAYALFLQFIFPGYIALPVPFHNDMYWSLSIAQNGFPVYLHWPRPVYFETLLLAGQFGLEGSLLFLAAIVVLDLALVLLVIEGFVLKYRLPWWLALGTILLMMAGPGFYAQPAFDVGYHLALLFGFLGIYIWEAHAPKQVIPALLASCLCFITCMLANEGFAPALLIYGALAAWRERRKPTLAVAVFALPLIAIALALVDDRLVHSPFVVMHAAKNYPYRIDLSPQSLVGTAEYYLGSLVNPAFFLLLAACVSGLWYNRRLPQGAALIVAGLSLYVPYLVLPNHLTDIYQWAGMPLFALVVPLAWIQNPPSMGWRVANASLGLALIATLVFQTTQYRDAKNAYGTVLAQNRMMIAGLRAHAASISRAHNILVRGLRFVSNPWAQTAEVVNVIVPNSAQWWVETEPGTPAIVPRANFAPIAGNAIDYARYDLVIDVDGSGDLSITKSP